MKSVSKETEEERREAEQFRFHTGRGLSSAYHAPATTACDASRGDWGNGSMATTGGVGELYAKGLGKWRMYKVQFPEGPQVFKLWFDIFDYVILMLEWVLQSSWETQAKCGCELSL